MCRTAIGRPGRPFSRGGAPLFQFASNSAFAERTVVKAVQAVRIPSDIPLTSAALIGCGVLTGVGAVLNRARVDRGESVVVIGTGGIGLNVLQGARIAGASTVVAVDSNPAKEEVARQFGATHFLASAEGVRELLPTGADHVFECVGSTALIRQAIDLLDRHGQAILLGMPAATAEASFVPAAMFLDKSILGCRYGSSARSTTSPCTPICTARAGCCWTNWSPRPIRWRTSRRPRTTRTTDGWHAGCSPSEPRRAVSSRPSAVPRPTPARPGTSAVRQPAPAPARNVRR